jgi:protein-tyrosine-phosphatase/predicted ATP-grasp superfamily ATP-dependent carboligase
MDGTVLVLGDDTRSFLAVVRSLGRRGLGVEAAPFDFASPALRSKYLRAVHRLPPYSITPQGWLEEMARILAAGRYDLIVPLDERSIIPLMAHREDLGGEDLPSAPRVLPGQAAFETFFDKQATRDCAAACGVPLARGRPLRPDDDARGLIAEFGLPLVLKPRRSYRIENLAQRRGVRIVPSEAALDGALAMIEDAQDHIVEEGLPGFGIGLSLLAKGGAVGPVFQHRRLHEPPSGGGSSYRVSMAPEAELVRWASAMAERAKLEGPAMFEFKRDPETGDTRLLEVNARFWGSLPLAVAAGVDFPWLVYRQLVLGEAPGETAYRVPCYSRSITADLHYLRERLSRPGSSGSAVPAALGILRTMLPREGQDSFSWRDPLPALAEYRRIATDAIESAARRSPAWRQRRASKRLETAQRRLAARPGEAGCSVVFLCHGNICRSPFAAALLRKRLGEDSGIAVAGAGLLPLIGRQTPRQAILAARKWEVDLEPHRSGHLGAEELGAFDLVVLFDRANETGLRALTGPQAPPALRLGDFLSGRARGSEIADPIGGDAADFEATYEQIATALEGLSSVLTARPSGEAARQAPARPRDIERQSGLSP